CKSLRGAQGLAVGSGFLRIFERERARPVLKPGKTAAGERSTGINRTYRAHASPMSQAPHPNAGIAIVGMDGRFPKAPTLDQFWRNLCEGAEAISFFDEEELAAAGGSSSRQPSNFVKARAVLEDADLFDAAFFGMHPKEAEL